MRVRMALKYSGISVYLREVELKNKPRELFQCSSKGTVPVLTLTDGTIIDESRDIMLWAINLNDPDHWCTKSGSTEINYLLNENDYSFKNWLDKYKYADRYPEQTAEYYRSQGEQFLGLLEKKLSEHLFLMGDNITLADIGIFPFIRQFAFVDRSWFSQSPYPKLQIWLEYFLQSELFTSVMEKYPPWTESTKSIILGNNCSTKLIKTTRPAQ